MGPSLGARGAVLTESRLFAPGGSKGGDRFTRPTSVQLARSLAPMATRLFP